MFLFFVVLADVAAVAVALAAVAAVALALAIAVAVVAAVVVVIASPAAHKRSGCVDPDDFLCVCRSKNRI